MTLLLGPPGCGKTTLLKSLSGNLDKSLKKTVFNGQPTAPDYDNIPYAVFWFCIIFYHLLHKIESGFA
ncbi:hypothetical protein ACS0TY_023248 [Phlomoides rotata]